MYINYIIKDVLCQIVFLLFSLFLSLFYPTSVVVERRLGYEELVRRRDKTRCARSL